MKLRDSVKMLIFAIEISRRRTRVGREISTNLIIINVHLLLPIDTLLLKI